MKNRPRQMGGFSRMSYVSTQGDEAISKTYTLIIKITRKKRQTAYFLLPMKIYANEKNLSKKDRFFSVHHELTILKKESSLITYALSSFQQSVDAKTVLPIKYVVYSHVV